MAKVDIVALLAMWAALLSALGAVIRQRSAQEVTDQPVNAFELMRLSLRDTRWWFGAVAAVVSFGLQAVALKLGSVVLVQPLLLTALLFALPLNARLANQPVNGRTWFWAVLLCVGVAVYVTVANPAAGYQRGSPETWVAVAALIGPALVLCGLGAQIWSARGTRIRSSPGQRVQARRVAAVLLAVVAATAWALLAVLTKCLADVLSDGLGQILRAPELYAWVVCALVGTICQQSSFRASALAVTLPTMAVVQPILASVLGVVVLGETLSPAGIIGSTLLAAAVMAIPVAAFALCRAEAAFIAPNAGAVEPPGLASINDPVLRWLIEGAAEDQTSWEQTLAQRSAQIGGRQG